MPSDPQHELSGYVVRLTDVEFPLAARRGDPLDYVTPLLGKVTHGKTVRESETACEFSFQHIRVDWAREDDFSLEALFACDPVFAEIFPLLFDPTTERFTFGGADNTDLTNDVLVVDEMSIRPEHRGHGLGGALLEDLLRQYRRQWAVLVLRAVPETVPGGPWSDEVYSHPFAVSGDAAKRKLRVYWAQFGFRPLGGGDLMARDARDRDPAPASIRLM